MPKPFEPRELLARIRDVLRRQGESGTPAPAAGLPHLQFGSLDIDRDARVTTSGYVHEVMAATLGQLQRVGLATRCPDPVALFDEVEDITRKFRSLHRRLNDARINRRGERWQPQPGPPRPPPLAAHTCHGQYLGAFPDLSAVGRMAIVTCLAGPVLSDLSEGSLTALALELHLRGVLWTLDHGGAVHVFRCPDPP